MGVHVIRVPDLGEGIAEVELVVWHVAAGDAIVEDQGARRRDDRQGVGRDSVAGRRQGARARRRGRADARGRLGADPHRGRGRGRGDDADGDAGAAAGAARRRLRQPRHRRQPPRAKPRQRRAPPRQRRQRAPARQRRRAVDVADGAPDRLACRSRARLGARHRPARRHRDRHAPAASSRPTSTPTSRAAARARSRRRRRRAPRRRPTTRRTTIKIVGLRRKIAQKMQESKRRIPHYTYVEEVDVTELEELARASSTRSGAPSAAASRCCRSWSAPSFSRCASSRWSTRASTTRPAC